MTEMIRKGPVSCFGKCAILWLVLICLAGMNFHGHGVSARQEGTPSSEPTVVITETPLPEETLLPVIATFSETPLPQSTMLGTETMIQTPSVFPSDLPESSATPQVEEQKAAFSGIYKSDEILIRFRKSASTAEINQCLFPSDAESISVIEEIGVWVIQVPDGRVAEAIAAISACPQSRYAEPNFMAFATDITPADPNFAFQYGLKNIRAPQGWNYSTGSTSVTIAILDTGVELAHPDLASKIVPGYDFIDDDAIPQDDNLQSHGTHVAGIAAASSNNGIGVAGVSWGARIMPVKVLGQLGVGPLSGVAEGIIWATNQGAQVINLSLGSVNDSQALRDAVNYAHQRGVILVAAAGNSAGTILYPALYPPVIAVGAVDSNDSHMPNSNTGEALDLMAPGLLIYSTTRNGYGYNSGTSMAAPHVSGLAAVLYGIPGNGSSALVESQMKTSAKDLGAAGFDYEYGFGLIQMDSALKLISSLSSPNVGEHEKTPSLFAMPPVPTFAGISTYTPIPSATIVTSTAAPSEQPVYVETLTATPFRNLTEPRARAINLTDWEVPCAGTAFVLAGLLLLLRGRKKGTHRL